MSRSSPVKEGYPRNDSPRGTWEISEKGTELPPGFRSKSSNSFVEHLLAIPDFGDDADFKRERSGPRIIWL